MSDKIWIGWRENSSSGVGELQYLEIPKEWGKNHIREILENLYVEGSYSEHYRGVEWEVLSHPPIDWIDQETTSLEKQVRSLRKTISRYKRLVKKIKVQ